MTAIKTPAPDAPAEEWGAFAVSIPDWRWMLGMSGHRLGGVPDPDDPATAGCLLALLGNLEEADKLADDLHLRRDQCPSDAVIDAVVSGDSGRISRAAIAAAAAVGRWPGGGE